jgi:hypothetical protein
VAHALRLPCSFVANRRQRLVASAQPQAADAP